MLSTLDGQTVVIIGGTGGLGLAAARACVEAGANVVVVGRDREKGLEAALSLGDKALSMAGDAAESSLAERAVALALERFGGFHALYHVAGGSGRKHGDGPLHELTDDGWARTVEMNLASVVWSNRAAVRQFLRQGTGGSILNCGSVLAGRPSPRFFSTHAYASAKAGIEGLTRSAAAFYAPQGIRFNVVAPALVATPMSERAQGNDAIMRFIRTKQPLDGGRIGQPEDLDAAVVWLLSDQSRFVTGQVIAIDGGWSVSEGQIPAG
jgi:NAD(P)-dependent dehydrogenase (short-subunit alcohol dehydrogenase family)